MKERNLIIISKIITDVLGCSSLGVMQGCQGSLSGRAGRALGPSLILRPPPFFFFCSLRFVFSIIRVAKNEEGLGTLITRMMSGEREVDVGGGGVHIQLYETTY